MDVFFLINIFRLYPRFKMSFEHNSVSKNFFLSACFCWDSRFSLRKLDQNFEVGRLIGYENSYLDSVFRYSKVFRLYAILHDAAGAVRSRTGKEICNSKAFFDIATAGRHWGLCTTYIKHNFFHQSKLGRDIELQNTHIVLFKSPRDVMQITTLGAQLSLGSELVDS